MRSIARIPLFLAVASNAAKHPSKPICHNQPGDPGFPTAQQLSTFNASIGGRLLRVVPSPQFCRERGGCTDEEWVDTIFRSNIPGAIDHTNWEQDYASNPPSLCFRNSTTCGQGSVPVYAVNATTAAHIQAGVRFAQQFNLKVSVKASGHDYLGRSTAKGSLLLWTRYMQDITFTEDFKVGNQSKGSVVTVGSGVGLRTLYQATKAKGKIFVGGTAQNVVPAGGYLQGAGHSPLSPTFGLGADNTFQFSIVLASGELVTANEITHPDLFWALRGGGAGSWGVIISATIQTFPAIDIVVHQAIVALQTTAQVAEIAQIHASHIFDWDDLHAAQYFYATRQESGYGWLSATYFPNTTIEAANASINPYIDEIAAKGFDIVSTTINISLTNDQLSIPTLADFGGVEQILGSRLIPVGVYRNNVSAVRDSYQKLLDVGTESILGHIVAGGKVSENANIDSAVIPGWRTAKTHIVVMSNWNDTTPLNEVEAIRQEHTNVKVPILAGLAGPGSASYTNEADLREPNFKTTFYGPNYQRLSAIKAKYDPHALFIVGAGVGSEHWSEDGLCRVS